MASKSEQGTITLVEKFKFATEMMRHDHQRWNHWAIGFFSEIAGTFYGIKHVPFPAGFKEYEEFSHSQWQMSWQHFGRSVRCLYEHPTRHGEKSF